MHYWEYKIKAAPELADILVALLADAPFDTFEETETGITAWMPAKEENEAIANALLSELQEQFEITWEKEFIEGQNWNEIWESNFQPVIARDFCAVRADFHETIPGVEHELVINPKMAFGTGHHETTWMCMSALQTLPLQNTQLLDYGCGTGILAILASRLGAAEIEAVDIEEQSYLNTIENSKINDVHNVIPLLGDINAVQGSNFDGILANINRHIILDSLPRLAEMTKPGGWLLISGIMLQDEEIVSDAAAAAGFHRRELWSRGNWLCIHLQK